ncbi:Ig-specific serine endopeptidase MIP [Mycoplasma sp. 480]|uniref:Ig-specific serine endopeptidase MIP n=1 Tax=Mycoplasma sp. 480 TaxID=3440155 RepID=UPI003F5129C4
MKKTKKLLLLPLISSSLIVFSSCQTQLNPSDSQPGKTDPKDPNKPGNAVISGPITQERWNNLVKNINVDYKGYDEFNRPKESVTFAKFAQNISSLKPEVVGINEKDVKVNVLAAIPDRDANGTDISSITGQGRVLFEFVSKKDPKIKAEKTIQISGFSSTPVLTDGDGYIKQNLTQLPKTEQQKYLTEWSQDQRYQKDNAEYLTVLKRQPGYDESTFRKDVHITQEEKTKFDAKAKEAGIDTFDSALAKGFTVPSYNEDGTYDGLKIYDAPELGKGPSWVDSAGRNLARVDGIARYLTNDHYKTAALQTFHVQFNNPDPEHPGEPKYSIATSGTMWILDYEKTTDGSYPTKWYFGTNLHVAEALNDKTVGFGLTRLNRDAAVRTKFKILSHDENFTGFGFQMKPKAGQSEKPVKVVYSGEDFLNSKPSDFLAKDQKAKFENTEEFADFAVIEIDFTKIDASNVGISAGIKGGSVSFNQEAFRSNPAEMAKIITNEYANHASEQIKFKTESYLKKYAAINKNLNYANPEPNIDNLYIVGYPSARNDYFLIRYEEDDQIKDAPYSFSLWTNAETKYFDGINYDQVTGKWNYTDEQINRGNYLSYEIGYRSFVDKPGVLDAFISATRTGKDLHVAKLDHNKQLIAAGLSYLPKHYVPIGGASGSSIRNQNNELVAIYHTSNNSAKTGVASAFRSEGYDYKGIYGGSSSNAYHLPQYDLIYGGGKDQKNSYRQALQKLYGDNYKTNLFDNITQIPEKFQFKNAAIETAAETNTTTGKK